MARWQGILIRGILSDANSCTTVCQNHMVLDIENVLYPSNVARVWLVILILYALQIFFFSVLLLLHLFVKSY